MYSVLKTLISGFMMMDLTRKKAKITLKGIYGERFSRDLLNSRSFLFIYLYFTGSKSIYLNTGDKFAILIFARQASTRFFCSLFSLPVPPGNPLGTKEEPTTSFSSRSVLEQARVQKLLLFGVEGSGTSTIFKQVCPLSATFHYL